MTEVRPLGFFEFSTVLVLLSGIGISSWVLLRLADTFERFVARPSSPGWPWQVLSKIH